LAFLRREKCNEVQGYLVGRPAPIAQYSRLTGAGGEPVRPKAAAAS
jgi:EAL domain-containing protein (putative c-di-GMP-specific phosphodiesterase class I)